MNATYEGASLVEVLVGTEFPLYQTNAPQHPQKIQGCLSLLGLFFNPFLWVHWTDVIVLILNQQHSSEGFQSGAMVLRFGTR